MSAPRSKPSRNPAAMRGFGVWGIPEPEAVGTNRTVAVEAPVESTTTGRSSTRSGRSTRCSAPSSGLRRPRSAAPRSAGESSVRELPMLRQPVVQLEPGDLAADEDVMLGLQVERRVEGAGRHVDVVRLTAHRSGEGRPAVAAEGPARAGRGRETADLVLSGDEAEPPASDAEIAGERRAVAPLTWPPVLLW